MRGFFRHDRAIEFPIDSLLALVWPHGATVPEAFVVSTYGDDKEVFERTVGREYTRDGVAPSVEFFTPGYGRGMAHLPPRFTRELLNMPPEKPPGRVDHAREYVVKDPCWDRMGGAALPLEEQQWHDNIGRMGGGS